MTGQPDDRSQAPSSRRMTGPGLLESCLWVSGFHFAQLLAAALLLFGLTFAAFGGWPSDGSLLLPAAEEFVASDGDWLMMALTGCATLGALFLILPAAFWRLGPSPRQALGARLPDARTAVLLTGAVLPLGILSDELYRLSSLLAERLQSLLAGRLPLLAGLMENVDTVALIRQQTESTAYPLLLIIVGLGPAIGEEVIFRGLIGRGLIARRGIASGVLLTSVLFAVAHLSPAHAVATLPVAVFLHICYLTAGSIWAPILVHFLNNALSVTMMKYSLGQDVHVSVVLLVSAGLYVTVIGALLVTGSSGSLRLPSPMGIPRNVSLMSTEASALAVAVPPRWLAVAAGSGAVTFTYSFVAAAAGG